MSENADRMATAREEISKMHNLLNVYERGTVRMPDGTFLSLDAGMITQLKQAFAASRTACITALNAISDQ